ncbi:MAG: TrmB family transcriptional regulator [Candidatus Aenigmarchaeota archaeon]|nr:TrmB family transcriptional regulator [Candidatus Aenigmarchaeota archaeon]
MLVSQKVLDALKTIGLNLYERKIWVALLAKGTATAGELAEIANVPRSRAYDILQSLAEKGFVIIQGGKPLKYVAVEPEEALERAKKKFEEKIREMEERINRIKNSSILRELKSLYSKGIKFVGPEELTGAIKGSSLRRQLERMFRGASKKIHIITTPEGLKDIFSSHFNVLREAKERGVQIKIATTYDKKYKNIFDAFSQIAEIRHLDEKKVPLYGKFAIVDGKELILGLTDPREVPPTQEIAIWSRSEHAAKSILEPLFNLIWENSRKI